MRIAFAALALAFAGPAHAAPCNDVRGCVVRAEFCRAGAGAEICHFERLFPEQGVGLCTMAIMGAAIQWIVGDEASGNIARYGCEIKYSAGPNGRLAGIFGFQGLLTASQSAFTVPWTGSTTYTSSSIAFGSSYGGGTNVLNESMLEGGSPGVAGGVLTLPLVSPPLYKGGTLGSTPFANRIAISGNDPVSGTIRIRRCKMWATTE